MEEMSISVNAGPGGVVSLGVSISDFALLVNHGKKFGNFLRVNENDGDLFETLGETPEAILKRRGLVEVAAMEKKWPTVAFIYHGKKVKGRYEQAAQQVPQESNRKKKKAGITDKPQTVDAFTWVMVAIVSALDACLPSSDIQELLTRVFKIALAGDEETENALRVHLRINIESWRSFGCARDIALSTKQAMRNYLQKHFHASSNRTAIPQLNDAEMKDMELFLVWLLDKDENEFQAMSAITFAVALAFESISLDVCAKRVPQREGQPCVRYRVDSHISGPDKPRGLGSRALQISWPRDNPMSMIDALGVGRDLEDPMVIIWKCGAEAAASLRMVGKAMLPYDDTQEVFYSLEEVPVHARIGKKFPSHIGLLAQQGFPESMQKIYEGLRMVTERQPDEKIQWLHSHVSQEYLLRNESLRSPAGEEYSELLLKYQALVFGFYYTLLEQLLSFELVEATAFFHGIWGSNSKTFLAMCTQLGHCLRSEGKVSRSHVLYIASAMYNGRRKVFNARSSIPRLVGILGAISVLALPLIRTTDIPEEIWKIAVVDLPIVNLIPVSSDGELMAGDGGGIRFLPATEDQEVKTAVLPQRPTKPWTVHPTMCMLFDSEQSSGVVMAARCGKRLVGWFNPLAADITFLSDAYQRESSYEADASDGVTAFEVTDEHWQNGQVRRPVVGIDGYQFGVVHSQGCPEMRYAMAGFYAGEGEEVAIARTERQFLGAYSRVEAQEQGIIIA